LTKGVTELLAPERLAASVSRVTGTMLGRTFRHAASTEPPTLWRTVVLPIPGKRPISVALSSDRAGCAALAAAMLGMQEDELDVGMIDDFLRELLNMTAGQIKNELSLDQALGLPRVVDGAKTFETGSWSHHVLDSNSVNLVVSLVTQVI
jgi:CheY-specific phosphatase CheX